MYSDPHLARWRVVVGGILALVVGVPLSWPLVGLVIHPSSWQAWGDWERIGELAGNTFLLMAGTLVFALPCGTIAAFLLYRTDLPLRYFFRFVVLLTLFVPLPLLTTAWQTALGSGGWRPLGMWNQALFWKPWATGLGPATWVHTMAALPWVILLVGQGLLWVERELEEDALTIVGPWRILIHVTLRRTWGVLGAAALWAVLPIVTEITVTDVMQVRTLAEETYTQVVLRDVNGLYRAMAISFPAMIGVGILLVNVVRRVERRIPSLEFYSSSPLVFPLGLLRWPLFFLTLIALTILDAVPLSSLIWKAGLAGGRDVWTGSTVIKTIERVLAKNSLLVVNSIELAITTGLIVALFSLMLCWLTQDSKRLVPGMLGILTLAWILPGPLIGFGLKEIILYIVEVRPAGLLSRMLYFGPSPAPVLWANVIRFLPFGMAILWPMVRMIPNEIRESAQLEGARPGRMLISIYFPLTLSPCLKAFLAVSVLSLGELGAGKIVETPDYRVFAHEIFEQMHYGVTNELAGLCLVLLGMVGLGAVLVLGIDGVFKGFGKRIL